MAGSANAQSNEKKKAPVIMPELEAAVVALADARQHLNYSGASDADADRELAVFREQVIDLCEQGRVLADRLSSGNSQIRIDEHLDD
jgi:hypothetical protein